MIVVAFERENCVQIFASHVDDFSMCSSVRLSCVCVLCPVHRSNDGCTERNIATTANNAIMWLWTYGYTIAFRNRFVIPGKEKNAYQPFILSHIKEFCVRSFLVDARTWREQSVTHLGKWRTASVFICQTNRNVGSFKQFLDIYAKCHPFCFDAAHRLFRFVWCIASNCRKLTYTTTHSRNISIAFISQTNNVNECGNLLFPAKRFGFAEIVL